MTQHNGSRLLTASTDTSEPSPFLNESQEARLYSRPRTKGSFSRPPSPFPLSLLLLGPAFVISAFSITEFLSKNYYARRTLSSKAARANADDDDDDDEGDILRKTPRSAQWRPTSKATEEASDKDLISVLQRPPIPCSLLPYPAFPPLSCEELKPAADVVNTIHVTSEAEIRACVL